MGKNNTVTNPFANSKSTKPNQPIAPFVQEADNLYTWCLHDAKELCSVGISTEMIEELPLRADACRKAEVIWNAKREMPSEAQEQWKLVAPEAIEFRAELLNVMRYAFRNAPDLLRIVSAITKGSGYADLIQDLNTIAFVGRQHIDLLRKIGFDTSLLNVAASKSKELAEVWAISKMETDNHDKLKQDRNKAFWHLHELVSEIRAAGKYAFRNDKNRLKGYSSTFWKRKNTKKTKSKHVKNISE